MTEETKTPPVHVRTIRVEIARAGEHELEITATLVDERPSDNPRWFGAEPPRVIHDMRLGLRVRHPDLVITEARSEMASHPYTIARTRCRRSSSSSGSRSRAASRGR